MTQKRFLQNALLTVLSTIGLQIGASAQQVATSKHAAKVDKIIILKKGSKDSLVYNFDIPTKLQSGDTAILKYNTRENYKDITKTEKIVLGENVITGTKKPLSTPLICFFSNNIYGKGLLRSSIKDNIIKQEYFVVSMPESGFVRKESACYQ